ncbi:hypothetical protein [Microcoleus sp. T3_D1]|uniref:hypothetical protein n=1 Tax=Microcoleus sp. T3_D1 TaxID=3055427 RepID=UPI002FD5E9CA
MPSQFLLEQNSIPVPRQLAATIGLEEATVFQQLWYSLQNPQMGGTVRNGQKWIRNPIECRDSEKQQRAAEHGKAIDWLSNFPFLSVYKLRRIFAKLENLGLVISRKLRASRWDHCKYYTIDNSKLTELLKALKLSICQFSTNRSVENLQMDLTTASKSYQDTISKKVLQKEPLTERASATVSVKTEDKETSQQTINCQVVKKQDLTAELTALQVEKCSAPSSSVERQKFYETLLAYCYQRVDIDKPEGYANWVMKESKSKTPEASVAMLWAEFESGEELGSRMVPAGYRLRGVPEQVVMEAISKDCISKVGATATEAAKSAAGQLSRLPVVAAVANAVKLQLERCIENATKQVELGIPKEQAFLNNLPTYAVAACTEVSKPQITETKMTEAIDSTDPYALTEENRAARNKAVEAINAAKVMNAKLPRRLSKREQILAANMAAAAEFVALLPAKVEEVAKPSVVEKPVEDEPILW